MEKGNVSGMLGICKKAGRMTVGTDLTVKAIREGKGICLLLLAKDASENTVKRATNCSAYYGVTMKVLPLGTEELGHLVGKGSNVAVVGVNDENFASAILTRL